MMLEDINPLITEYKSIHIGDMVTTYHKGYFEVLGFAHYGNNPTGAIQCIYRRVADSGGQPCGGKPKSCHADYVKKIDHKSLKDDNEYEDENLRLKYCALHKILRKLEAAQWLI